MYRAGVIGCRGIGAAHATGIVGSDRARLVAACDLDEATLHEFEQRWPDAPPALYRDHREMLAREVLDIVTVATSDHRHADLVVDAANAGAKGIFCEKPLATNLADADRMIAACDANSTTLSVDHTRRFMPLWRHAKEAIVDRGVIGPVQYVIGTLAGPRAMLFRNGTHTLDAICYYAGAQPQWVVAELEEGYAEYAEYRGDGGHVPATEPGANGYIHFAEGVRGFYIGGSKTTPAPKQQIEVVGTTGRVRLGNDGGTLYRGEEAEPLAPPAWPVEGIPAGIHELIAALDQGVESVSPGRAGHLVVELIIGFLESQKQGNVPVPIPVPR